MIKYSKDIQIIIFSNKKSKMNAMFGKTFEELINSFY